MIHFILMLLVILIPFILSVMVLNWIYRDATWVDTSDKNHIEEGKQSGEQLRAASDSLRNSIK